MGRLNQKCLAVSIGIHSVLLVVLLVGPGFVESRQPAPDLGILKVIPSRLVDAAMSGGGNPAAKASVAPPAAQPPAPVTPPAAPPKARPEPPARQPEPPPPKSAPAPERETPAASRDITPKTVAGKPAIKVDPKIVSRSDGESSPKKPASRAPPTNADTSGAIERQLAARHAQSTIKGALENLNDNLSGGTVVDIPGPGGAAYANYSQVVKSLYDQAWIDPQEVTDEQATVRVDVVVSRDGTILSDRIVERSRVPALDRSVQNALDKVRLRGLPRFPDGTMDTERTFRINFNLKAKRFAG
jgi:TonB family protein